MAAYPIARRGIAARALIVLIVVVTVGLTYAAGHDRGMSTVISTRDAYYSMPYAISTAHHGTSGYVILRDVAAFFIAAFPDISNETLAQAASLTPAPGRKMYFPGDDKGDADFVIGAFRVFGERLESLYYAWFALYLAAVAIFVLAHWRSQARLAALGVLTIAVYVGVFALPLTRELATVHNPRVFGVVSLIAVLHLSFAMLDRHSFTLARVLGCAAQSLLIALTVHVRTPEAWQVMAVVGVGAWVAARSRFRRPHSYLWPAGILLVALLALQVYQRLSIAEIYETTHLQRRTMWHNVGVGFALNPELARTYQLTIDDLPMIKLIRRHLEETNRSNEIDLIFRPEGEEDYQFEGIAKDFARYERAAREVVWVMARSHTRAVIKTFVIDKPRVALRQFAWAAGYRDYSLEDLYLDGQSHWVIAEDRRAAQSVYLNPFRPWALVAIALIALVARLTWRPGDDAAYAQGAGLACWLFVISLLPAMLAYPIISTLGVVLVTAPLAFLALGLLGARWALMRPHLAATP